MLEMMATLWNETKYLHMYAGVSVCNAMTDVHTVVWLHKLNTKVRQVLDSWRWCCCCCCCFFSQDMLQHLPSSIFVSLYLLFRPSLSFLFCCLQFLFKIMMHYSMQAHVRLLILLFYKMYLASPVKISHCQHMQQLE